jgi:hypothetical protein
MPIHTTDTREAALRQLHRINRWLVAGSVVLTGAFVEAAAHAFPGRATKNASTSKVKRTGARVGSPSRTTTHPLQPPAQAPQATTESSPSSQSAPSQESPAASQEPAPEAAPTQEAAPAHESAEAEEPAPAQESAPAHESAPAEESAPVVSGGS